MTCKHERGDWIEEQGFWLCSGCWQKLPERPRKYGPPQYGSGVGTAPPQALIWQAAVHIATSNLSLNDFLRTMVRRFERKGKLPRAEAYTWAIATLESLGDPFGDPAYEWTHAAARELVDDEINEGFEKDGGNG